MRATLAVLATVLLAPSAAAADPAPDPKGVEFFEKKVRPVLVAHCYSCHSAGANKTKGGLAVDTRAGLREGGDGGPAVVPGKPAEGTLLRALRHDGPVKMPSESKKLPDDVLADIETWIRAGAADPRDGKAVAKKGIDYADGRTHWAYQPVKAAPPPAVKDAAWPKADLDRFVLAGIEGKGLAPAPDAARHAWLRRVTFDLTGLPPTPEEADAFLKDTTPDAPAKVVDRLLASPGFGEHWARHWLDGVRFNARLPTVDRYRDWVVRAFNADLPYDRFVTLQLAGDLLPPDPDPRRRADALIATQFLALNADQMDPVEGMVEVVGQQLLGVSVNCAKCHDHKFDAYSQADYYALAGIFTSTKILGEKNTGREGVAVPGEAGRIMAVGDGKVGDTPLLVRGERGRVGPLVPRRFPAVLAGDGQTPLGRLTKGSGRLELARWVADPAHPLTARVMANRVWQRLTGRPLVGTPNDFGTQGDRPTNPALLDHLAARLVAGGWSVKGLVREVALSRTYRQSAANPAAAAADPENRLLARLPVRRLSYEQTADALQAVAGVLVPGPPPAPDGKKRANVEPPQFGGKQPSPHRALYHADPVTHGLFDGAEPDLLVDKRDESVTAPQMLFLLNNPHVGTLAGRVARRAEALAGSADPAARAAAAYKLLFARPPADGELAAAVRYLGKNPFDRFCHVLLCTSEFLYLE